MPVPSHEDRACRLSIATAFLFALISLACIIGSYA